MMSLLSLTSLGYGSQVTLRKQIATQNSLDFLSHLCTLVLIKNVYTSLKLNFFGSKSTYESQMLFLDRHTESSDAFYLLSDQLSCGQILPIITNR